MDINLFIEKFSDQFDETDLNEFKPETDFKNLDEWNSLIALSVISMVDTIFCVRINGDDIRVSNTINDLFQIIINKS